MSTALFTLRAIQVGIPISELDLLDFGEVLDILTESNNDNFNYKEVADQSDFDKF